MVYLIGRIGLFWLVVLWIKMFTDNKAFRSWRQLGGQCGKLRNLEWVFSGFQFMRMKIKGIDHPKWQFCCCLLSLMPCRCKPVWLSSVEYKRRYFEKRLFFVHTLNVNGLMFQTPFTFVILGKTVKPFFINILLVF